MSGVSIRSSGPVAMDLRPAILGGPPAVTVDQTEAHRWPIITGDDEDAVLRVLRSGELSSGHLPGGYPCPHTEVVALEAEFARFLGLPVAETPAGGSPCVLAHNNGTAALLGALHALGVKPGDEVLVPTATWWSTAMTILHVGAIPVFVESDADTLALDPVDAATRITPKTRAMVVTHLFGIPAKMDELLALCEEHGLKLLEDASHAHGATHRGRPVGTIGHAGVFSLQANKLLPSAEGGLLVSRDPEIVHHAARFGHYERLVTLKDHPDRRFAGTGFGFKFRMSPLSAALARSQLRRLEERNAERSRNCERLSRRLAALGLKTFMNGDPGLEHAGRVYFEFLVQYDQERFGAPVAMVAKALQAEGVMAAAPRYPLLHQQPVFTEGRWRELARLPGALTEGYRFDPASLPRTARANGSLIRLPTLARATEMLLDQYALAFEKVLGAAGHLPRV